MLLIGGMKYEGHVNDLPLRGQIYVGLLVPIHIIFCRTNHTRWIKIYDLYLGITHRERLQNILEQ